MIQKLSFQNCQSRLPARGRVKFLLATKDAPVVLARSASRLPSLRLDAHHSHSHSPLLLRVPPLRRNIWNVYSILNYITVELVSLTSYCRFSLVAASPLPSRQRLRCDLALTDWHFCEWRGLSTWHPLFVRQQRTHLRDLELRWRFEARSPV
jgi:hypothetical protein